MTGSEMTQRVSLLAWLLALAVGSGAVAQSPTPEATPLYAPDDLASALPSRVGDIALVAVAWTGPEILEMTDDAKRAAFTSMLTRLGKDPGDLLIALASPADKSAPDAYLIYATRVAGVPALTLMDELQRAALGRHDKALPTDGQRISLPVAGRVIYPSYATSPGQSYEFFYPRGEVLFSVEGYGDVTIEDVLAELA